MILKATDMGSYMELNYTLQITAEQGFPKELDLKKHQKKPPKPKDFRNNILSSKTAYRRNDGRKNTSVIRNDRRKRRNLRRQS